MTKVILEVNNITKKFDKITALDNFDFKLQQGEIHVLIGKNGSGKSTFANILTGLIIPDKGNIYLSGKKLRLNSTFIKKSGIVSVCQECNLYHNMTVAENIFSTNLPRKKFSKTINKKELYIKTNELFSELKFSIDPEKYVRELNYAEKRIVEIARALYNNAAIIIFDEAVSSMTTIEANPILKKMLQMKKKGVSFIYITHRLDEINKIADTISIIRNGHLSFTGKKESVTTKLILDHIYGPLNINRYPKLNIKKRETALEVKNLISKDKTINDISFSLRRGEAVGITGLVGSGKNELGSLLLNSSKRAQGSFYVNDIETAIQAPKDSIKNNIAYISNYRFEENLYSKLSIYENILSVMENYNAKFINKNREQIKILNYLQLINAPFDTDRKIFTLSEGNQQKITLTKWLFSFANIFIINEPTASIDLASKSDIYNIFNDLLRNGAALLLISSDIEEILGTCDRILLLDNGKISYESNCSETSISKIHEYLFHIK